VAEALQPVIVVPGPEALAETAARWIADTIRASVTARARCFLALAGGETPRACYQVLGGPGFRDEVPWSAVDVYWSDERLVPLDNPASNYATARAALLDHVPIPASQIHPAPVDEPDGARAAEAYARELAILPRDAAGRPRFDLMLLGLGEDGHTASLFPGDPVLLEDRAWVRAVRASKPPPARLTLTLPVINASRGVLFLVQGAAKRSALQAVRRRDPRVPASLVQPVDGELRFIVDREALVEDPATV
jgi:6-phosphogluconolactonase